MLTSKEILQALLVSMALSTASALGWLSAMERPVGDMLMRIPHPGGSVDSAVAAVVIDDRSLQAFGPAPWPRDRIAELVQRILETKPQAVVLDTVLSERRNQLADGALQRALQDTEHVLAAALSPDGGWLLPIDEFGGADLAAHAHAETDTDGVVRSIASTKQASGLALPALSISAARLAGWTGSFQPGQLVRPDFRQGPNSVMTVSAADVLKESTLPHSSLTGRVVFVGYSASGVGDRFFIPVGDRNRPSPGVLVHAAVTSSILLGGLLVPLPFWLTLPMVFVIALAVQMLRTRSGRLRLRAFSLVLVGTLAVALLLLWSAHVVVPAVAFVLAAVLSGGVREAAESRAAQQETGKILRSLLEESSLEKPPVVPRGTHGRLELVQILQDQLARDRNLRRTLLEGLNEGVVLWNETGEPLISNAALGKLWGHPPSIGEIRSLVSENDNSPSNAYSAEIDRNGRSLEIQLLGLTAGELGLIRDVTERSELDRRRRETHRLVSHELKTPLSSIAGFGEMLQTYDLSADELKRVAGIIQSEAVRLGEMVRVFLDIERLGSAHWETEQTEIDLGSLVTQRVGVLQQAALARSQTINAFVSDCSPISGAEQLLSQLIDNLVGNALKFSPTGTEIRVEVGPNTTTNHVEMKVVDHGPGIPEDSLPHLFEKFYRVPGSRSPGSGLGLAFVKEVANWHGATVHVDSKVGEGSTFTVEFQPTGDLR